MNPIGFWESAYITSSCSSCTISVSGVTVPIETIKEILKTLKS